MSSLAVHACDDMAPISLQPGVLLVPFKLVGDTEARSKAFVYYNMVSKSAGGHLQGAQRGPLRIFEFLELFASIARSRSRSPNDIVSANSCTFAPRQTRGRSEST